MIIVKMSTGAVRELNKINMLLLYPTEEVTINFVIIIFIILLIKITLKKIYIKKCFKKNDITFFIYLLLLL